MGVLTLQKHTSAPDTPGTGKESLVIDIDDHWKTRDEDGNEFRVSTFDVHLPLASGISSPTGSAARTTDSNTHWNWDRWSFDQSSTEGVSWFVMLPNREFSGATLRLGWSAGSGSVGADVTWRVRHRSTASGSIDVVPSGTTTFTTSSFTGADTWHVASGTLDVSAWGAGQGLQLEIQRVPSAETASVAADADLLAAVIEIS